MGFRDSQRYRKVYGYFRPIPRPEDPVKIDKDYVDDLLNSFDWKQSVKVVSTTNISLTSPGAIDGVTLVDEDRVLLTGQTSGVDNGIYIYYTATDSLVRTLDNAQDSLTCGATCYIEDGTYEKTYWTLTTLDPITVGTTAQTWENIIGASTGTPGGSSGQIQYNQGGTFGGATNVTWTAASNTLSAINISTTALTASFLSGSLTKLQDGTSYLIAGTNVSITSASNGSVIISSAGSGGTLPGGSINQLQYNDGAGNFAGAGITWTASTNALTTTNASVTALTASFLSGSLTRLQDGKSYLVAGSNITITSQSNGQVLVESTGGSPAGSNTTIQFNDGGIFGGATNVTWTAATNTLSAINISSTALTASYISGSLTRLQDGKSYLVAGYNTAITSGSNGQVTIASTTPEYFFSTTNGSIFTTGSAVFRGANSSLDSPYDIGTDVFFYVSGSIAATGANKKIAVFGGDVYVSGTINANSITTVTGSWTVSTGSVTLPYNFITGNYTADNDYYMKCSGTFTLNLPTAIGKEGRTYIVKNFSSGTITIDPFSSQTIDGSTTLSFSTQYTSYTLVSDGSNWMIV